MIEVIFPESFSYPMISITKTLEDVKKSVEIYGLERTQKILTETNKFYFQDAEIELFPKKSSMRKGWLDRPGYALLYWQENLIQNCLKLKLLRERLREDKKDENNFVFFSTLNDIFYPKERVLSWIRDYQEKVCKDWTEKEKINFAEETENLQCLIDFEKFPTKFKENSLAYRFWNKLFNLTEFEAEFYKVIDYNYEKYKQTLTNKTLSHKNESLSFAFIDLQETEKIYYYPDGNYDKTIADYSVSKERYVKPSIEHLVQLFDLNNKDKVILNAVLVEQTYCVVQDFFSSTRVSKDPLAYFHWYEAFASVYNLEELEVEDFIRKLKTSKLDFPSEDTDGFLLAPYASMYSLVNKIFSRQILEAINLNTATYKEICDVFLKVEKPSVSSLTLKNFNYLQPHLDKLVKATGENSNLQKPGLDILIWGRPGLGKTELVKVLAQNQNLNICEISLNAEASDDKTANNKRLQMLSFTKKRKSLLDGFVAIIDEAEDILSKPELKHVITKELGNKELTTFWIINDLKDIHEAYLRRFDYVLEMSDMPIAERIEFSKSLLKEKMPPGTTTNEVENLAFKIAQAMSRPSEIKQAVEWCVHTDDFSWTNIHEKIENYQQALLRSKNETTGSGHAEIINPTHDARHGFDNFAGYAHLKEEAKDIIDIFKNPARYSALGAKVPKGVLLSGSPGVGKTMFVKCLAQEVGVPIVKCDSSALAQSTDKIKDLFKTARNYAPCIVFIDEIDVLASSITDMMGNVILEKQKVLNPLLVELDGFESLEGILVVAATHRHNVLDKSILRSGRFGKQIYFAKPHYLDRLEIFKYYAQKVKIASDINFSQLAKISASFSSADIALSVNEAALLSAQRAEDYVSHKAMIEAVDKIFWGTSLGDMPVSNLSKWKTAVHEAGHALLALKVGMRPQRATIRPHTDFLGMVELETIEGNHNKTLSQIKEFSQVFLGGRQAEQLVFGEHSDGVESDLQKLTSFLTVALRTHGMGETLKAASFSSCDRITEKVYEQLEIERQDLVDTAEKETTEFLHQHKKQLLDFAKLLLEKRSLEQTEMLAWFEENLKPVYDIKFKEEQDLSAIIAQSYAGLE